MAKAPCIMRKLGKITRNMCVPGMISSKGRVIKMQELGNKLRQVWLKGTKKSRAVFLLIIRLTVNLKLYHDF